MLEKTVGRDEPRPADLAYRSFPEYDRLKDLLQSGKSGTMFSSTAYSSAGQFRNEGSTGLTRATDVSPSASTQYQTGPRHASTTAVACAPLRSTPSGARAGPCPARVAAIATRRAASRASSI